MRSARSTSTSRHRGARGRRPARQRGRPGGARALRAEHGRRRRASDEVPLLKGRSSSRAAGGLSLRALRVPGAGRRRREPFRNAYEFLTIVLARPGKLPPWRRHGRFLRRRWRSSRSRRPCLVGHVRDPADADQAEHRRADDRRPDRRVHAGHDQREHAPRRPGTTFTNNFASYPLCCPSRSTYITGQYGHNHTIMGNARRAAATTSSRRRTRTRSRRGCGRRATTPSTSAST